MIEQIMFLSIGFSAAGVLLVTFIPVVHARAVRLTSRRYQERMPASVTEMQVEKEFALSTKD